MSKGLVERFGLYAENILAGAVYKAQKRIEEEKEQRGIKEFEKQTLGELLWYTGLILKLHSKEEKVEYTDKLEDKLESLKIGRDSVLCYRMPEERQKN